MIAYGDEINVAYPPRPGDARTPWNINWRVKVRYKSTLGTILGMPSMAGDPGDDASGRAQDEQQKPPPKPGRGGIGGALIRHGLGF